MQIKWIGWMAVGVNVFLCIAAAAGIIAAVIYLWRNYQLEEVILEYERKEKKRLEREEAALHMEEETGGGRIASFVTPKELFELLQIESVQDLVLDRQRNVQAVDMSVNSNEFSRMIHSMSAREVFSFINRFFQGAIPQIYQEGGIVEAFREAGMTVLFLKDYERAIVAAVSVCELLNELGAEQELYTGYSIGMTYENAIVGVVGDRQRMDLLTLSADSSGLSEWLQSIAVKYYARILVTEAYAQLIEDFHKKFNTRLLGYVYLHDTKSMERIYDVYDGDEKEVRNRKRQTKMLFEKGVRLFAGQDYQQSRQCFIEVLKTDRFDQAAKEYIYRCEAYIRQPEEGKVYIDSYGLAGRVAEQ